MNNYKKYCLKDLRVNDRLKYLYVGPHFIVTKISNSFRFPIWGYWEDAYDPTTSYAHSEESVLGIPAMLIREPNDILQEML